MNLMKEEKTKNGLIKGYKMPPFTAQHRANIASAAKKRIRTEEEKSRLREMGRKHTSHTEEAKAKISAAGYRRWAAKETKCVICGETDINKMARSVRENSGVLRLCRMCRNKQQRKLKMKTQYGLTPEDVEIMYKKQNGLCALCLKAMNRPPDLKSVIDHNHVTNEVRGIIHRKCNSLLGFADDDVSMLELARAYLLRNLARGSA